MPPEIKIHGSAVEMVAIADLRPFAQNAREHPEDQIALLARVIADSGFTAPLIIDPDNEIIAGHGRLLAATRAGMTAVPCVRVRDLTPDQIRGLRLSDNQIALLSDWNPEALNLELGALKLHGFDLSLTGFADLDLSGIMDGLPSGSSSGGGGTAADDEKNIGALADRFGIPPFSVLNAREGWWQDRKRAWISLGIKSELGRGEGATWGAAEEITSPGLNHYRDKEKAERGQKAASFKNQDKLDAYRKPNAATGGSAEPLARARHGQPSPMKAKQVARTFGQDLMRGEHDVGGPRVDPQSVRGGVFQGGTPDTARDSQFYAKKRAAERVLGRELTIDEFRADHYIPDDASTAMGTSIFDPVLCELSYRWFCPPGGAILDPFAGGSVRGIVAGALGRSYTGVDLRPEQVHANRLQAELVFEDRPGGVKPQWIVGDSASTIPEIPGEFDFIFSCPPYADLEVYSDDPADLSTMDYPEFRHMLDVIVEAAVAKLKPDRFAAFVVGDVRGPDGNYRNFVSHTIDAFEKAGCRLYNEAILVTALGSLPIRAGRQFAASRKLGKTHQNILVFVKGSGAKAADAVGPVEFGEIDPAGETVDEQPILATADADTDRFSPAGADYPPTPVQQVYSPEIDADVWVKRDDLFEIAGVRGGKVRSCWSIATAQPVAGLITAGSRASPQVNIVAHIAKALGVPCRVHIPTGDLGPELIAARDAGAEIIQHKAGYNTVIVKRAAQDAEAHPGWLEVPFGMECDEAVRQTASQVATLPHGQFSRIVMPVGSGMSFAGVLWGLLRHYEGTGETPPPVLGVQVGADPAKRLAKYAPPGWRDLARIVVSEFDYHDPAPVTEFAGIALDPIYEAKCLPYLQEGDLFWIVGIREAL